MHVSIDDFFATITDRFSISKYKSWRITGPLPWAALLFVAGFALHAASTYRDHDLSIFIAATVLLLVAPLVLLTHSQDL